jgi:hypothetical protein
MSKPITAAITRAVLEDCRTHVLPSLDASTYAVLAAYARKADRTVVATMEQLTRWLGRAKYTIAASLRRLQRAGHITKLAELLAPGVSPTARLLRAWEVLKERRMPARQQASKLGRSRATTYRARASLRRAASGSNETSNSGSNETPKSYRTREPSHRLREGSLRSPSPRLKFGDSLRSSPHVAKEHDGMDRTDQPALFQAPPPQPAAPNAGHLVRAWWVGYRETKQRPPHKSLIRRVAGRAKQLAKDCDSREEWQEAYDAFLDAGRAGKYEPLAFYNEPTGRSPVVTLTGRAAASEAALQELCDLTGDYSLLPHEQRYLDAIAEQQQLHRPTRLTDLEVS